ncbi:hypothetical protein L1987_20094 [Smallanthus sonchifolius]|uniref:Uncharacterized protein n=1 Tax=Smallanthus sonchifolius TaxID=185202 RepID=A0ACB9IR39_9ASTR|nr:hypothetical protein L1987_20094 [Smallanthus sonchifolius]
MTGSRHQNDTVENFVRQNTRMIVKHSAEKPNTGYHRLYKCKDCNKEYNSFQALGGHRASHRAPIPHTPTDTSGVQSPETHHKRKLHECKICKKGFEIGQSLGGHMRKHWRRKDKNTDIVPADSLSSSCSSSSTSIAGRSKGEVVFEYDLNLMPNENEWSNGARLDKDSSLPS